MEIWFLSDIGRLNRERDAVEKLHRESDWLIGVAWHLEGDLCIDAVIRVHGHDYEVTLRYPPTFPHSPPFVKPKYPDQHWSGHQYQDGTLCLEWGPDTWHPEVTGAQVLVSTFSCWKLKIRLVKAPRELLPPVTS